MDSLLPPSPGGRAPWMDTQVLMQATSGKARGAIRVLVVGADMATERALLARLRTLAADAAPDAAAGTGAQAGIAAELVACSDLSACALLVARGGSAMARVGLRMAETRPELPYWILDDDGALFDGRLPEPAPALDEATLASRLRGLPVGPAAMLPHAPPAAADAGDPAGDDAGPLGILLRERMAAAAGQAALLVDGEPWLLVDFDRALALSPTARPEKELASDLAAAFHRMRIGPLSARAFNDQLALSPALPLAPLLWNVALQVEGEPPSGPGQRDRALVLRQWPDFRALAHRHDHFRMCCVLLKRQATAGELAALLELDVDTVRAFYEAAWLSGYASVAGAAASATPVQAAVDAGEAPRRRAGSALARMWQTVRRTMGGGA